jgi:hypothetical protein
MKEPVKSAAPVRAAASSRAETRTSTRIKLELLDAYNASQESRGYDPYNAGDHGRPFDVWRNKSKRR